MLRSAVMDIEGSLAVGCVGDQLFFHRPTVKPEEWTCVCKNQRLTCVLYDRVPKPTKQLCGKLHKDKQLPKYYTIER